MKIKDEYISNLDFYCKILDSDIKLIYIYKDSKIKNSIYYITLVNNCGIQRSISSLPNNNGTLNIQLSYISNNINNYVRPITCSAQTGCWIYGAPNYQNNPSSPSSPSSCICIDTDSLQADINSGVIGC